MLVLFDYNMNELLPTGRWLIKRKLTSKASAGIELSWQKFLYIEATTTNSLMPRWYIDTDLNLIEVNE